MLWMNAPLRKVYTGHNMRHAVDAGEDMGYLVGDYVFENGVAGGLIS
jgi:hypothetical protein